MFLIIDWAKKVVAHHTPTEFKMRELGFSRSRLMRSSISLFLGFHIPM